MYINDMYLKNVMTQNKTITLVETPLKLIA